MSGVIPRSSVRTPGTRSDRDASERVSDDQAHVGHTPGRALDLHERSVRMAGACDEVHARVVLRVAEIEAVAALLVLAYHANVAEGEGWASGEVRSPLLANLTRQQVQHVEVDPERRGHFSEPELDTGTELDVRLEDRRERAACADDD